MAANQKANPMAQNVSELEKGLKGSKTSSTAEELIIVSWDGPSDPANPLNWSRARKWFITLLTSFGGLVTLMSGVMLAPALTVMSEDLHASKEEAAMAMSIYILGFAFGPMILAPCSELFGRRPVWIAGCLWYVLWNTLCGVSHNRGLLIIGRLMSGVGASVEFAVSGPIANDCWSSDERGKSMAIRGFLPLLGPALGPIVGGVMVQEVNWKWIFFVLSIVDAIVVLLFFFSVPETHAQTLLSRKATALRKSTGAPHYTEDDLEAPKIGQKIKFGLFRPTRLLLTQPIIQVISLVQAFTFGLLYIVHSTFATLWTEKYRQSSTSSGLHYIAIVIGCTIASLTGGWLTDKVWARLKRLNEGECKPEYRIPLLIPAVILMPVGLLWYGWTAEKMLHWVLPDIGIALFGCGYIFGVTAAQTYVIEAFPDHTASAGAASQILRNIFAFAFPLFAPRLYSTLGYGVGNTVLAALAIGLGIPAPFILWKYGESLRRRGKAFK